MKMIEQNGFFELDLQTLSNVQGGDRASYCSGQIAGRIFLKKLLGQKITSKDYICQ